MPMLTNTDILKRLKTLREEKDLRQEYIARRLGLDRTTYVRKENGAIPITTDEWLKIAQAMEKDPSYFFSKLDAFCELDRDLKEQLIQKLYRALKKKEQEEFISHVCRALKDIRRPAVQEILEILSKA